MKKLVKLGHVARETKGNTPGVISDGPQDGQGVLRTCTTGNHVHYTLWAKGIGGTVLPC